MMIDVQEIEEREFLSNSYLYLAPFTREERQIQTSACRCNCSEDPPEEAAFCTHSFVELKWVASSVYPGGGFTYLVCESCGLDESDHVLSVD